MNTFCSDFRDVKMPRPIHSAVRVRRINYLHDYREFIELTSSEARVGSPISAVGPITELP